MSSQSVKVPASGSADPTRWGIHFDRSSFTTSVIIELASGVELTPWTSRSSVFIEESIWNELFSPWALLYWPDYEIYGASVRSAVDWEPVLSQARKLQARLADVSDLALMDVFVPDLPERWRRLCEADLQRNVPALAAVLDAFIGWCETSIAQEGAISFIGI